MTVSLRRLAAPAALALAAVLHPETGLAEDAGPLAEEVISLISHVEPAGDFVYALEAGVEGCVLTIVDEETEISDPATALRTTTIVIDLAGLDRASLAVDEGFVVLAMKDDGRIGYQDSYSYGRIDRLDEREKTLDIAAEPAAAERLVAALDALAGACQGGSEDAAPVPTGADGFWGEDTPLAQRHAAAPDAFADTRAAR